MSCGFPIDRNCILSSFKIACPHAMVTITVYGLTSEMARSFVVFSAATKPKLSKNKTGYNILLRGGSVIFLDLISTYLVSNLDGFSLIGSPPDANSPAEAVITIRVATCSRRRGQASPWFCTATFLYLVVEPTPLRNINQNGNLPQIGVKIKNIWNHHPVLHFTETSTWLSAALPLPSIQRR